MKKKTIEEIVDNMVVWDIIKLIEVLQEKFGDEPDYKNINEIETETTKLLKSIDSRLEDIDHQLYENL